MGSALPVDETQFKSVLCSSLIYGTSCLLLFFVQFDVHWYRVNSLLKEYVTASKDLIYKQQTNL